MGISCRVCVLEAALVKVWCRYGQLRVGCSHNALLLECAGDSHTPAKPASGYSRRRAAGEDGGRMGPAVALSTAAHCGRLFDRHPCAPAAAGCPHARVAPGAAASRPNHLPGSSPHSVLLGVLHTLTDACSS